MYTEAQRTAPSELGYIFPDAQVLYERREACLSFRSIGGDVHEHTDAAYPLVLLRARRERPRGRAAEQRDELATL